MFADYLRFRSTGQTVNDLVELPAIASVLSDLDFDSACDIACGTGTYIPHLRAKAGRVVCCDASPSAIRHCQQRFASLGGVTYVLNDYRALEGLYREQFDLVLVSLAIFDNLTTIVRVARSLLRPGGYLIYSHFHPVYGAGKSCITENGITISAYWGQRERSASEPFGRVHATQAYRIDWEYHTIEEHVSLVRSEGFVVDAILEPRAPNLDESLRLSRSANRFPILVIVVARKDGCS